jgi:septal ring factor EnvC (AmiA/AmiB activator)
MSDMIRQRLDQIDGKLDKLSDAVSRLAAVEERLIHQNHTLDNLNHKLEDSEKRIRLLEHQASARGVVLASVERFGWLILTTTIGIVAYTLKD